MVYNSNLQNRAIYLEVFPLVVKKRSLSHLHSQPKTQLFSGIQITASGMLRTTFTGWRDNILPPSHGQITLKVIFEKLNMALVFKVFYLLGTDIRTTSHRADIYPHTSLLGLDRCLLEHWHSVKQFENQHNWRERVNFKTGQIIPISYLGLLILFE